MERRQRPQRRAEGEDRLARAGGYGGGHLCRTAAEQRSQTAILTGNYGEAGAIDLYGPAFGLPQAISGINSYWERGYGDPPPTSLIVLGYEQDWASILFNDCKPVGEISNPYNVMNEETRSHKTILLCGGPRQPWPETWARIRGFG